MIADRAEITEKVLSAKKEKMTFDQSPPPSVRNKVWVASALLGQSTMSREEAEKAVKCSASRLDRPGLQDPRPGSLGQPVPGRSADLYRFHEITQVYGTTLKAIIHEMSATAS